MNKVKVMVTISLIVVVKKSRTKKNTVPVIHYFEPDGCYRMCSLHLYLYGWLHYSTLAEEGLNG